MVQSVWILLNVKEKGKESGGLRRWTTEGGSDVWSWNYRTRSEWVRIKSQSSRIGRWGEGPNLMIVRNAVQKHNPCLVFLIAQSNLPAQWPGKRRLRYLVQCSGSLPPHASCWCRPVTHCWVTLGSWAFPVGTQETGLTSLPSLQWYDLSGFYMM